MVSAFHNLISLVQAAAFRLGVGAWNCAGAVISGLALPCDVTAPLYSNVMGGVNENARDS